jgi:hypothetical protein
MSQRESLLRLPNQHHYGYATVQFTFAYVRRHHAPSRTVYVRRAPCWTRCAPDIIDFGLDQRALLSDIGTTIDHFELVLNNAHVYMLTAFDQQRFFMFRMLFKQEAAALHPCPKGTWILILERHRGFEEEAGKKECVRAGVFIHSAKSI